MANPTQPDVGSSLTITTPSNQDTESSHTGNTPTPIPHPASSIAAPPTFPPPKLQHDQSSSNSIRTPNVLSPANGAKTATSLPHLSTPPGPPVFTSAVRPAAVPFRTSPASPQPVAFFSDSPLPTSSPPPLAQFLNASFELQHQVSDGVDDHVPIGESNFVRFSAHKVYSSLF